VEICASVKAVKYIHKYIYKGSDKTTIEITQNTTDPHRYDEIHQRLHGRFIAPPEAAWRLFEYATHEEWPSVTALPVHLPGQQDIRFSANATAMELQQQLERSDTHLTVWFRYNIEYPDTR